MAFELPTLNYSHSALAAKGMCEETLDIHYGKHHQAYVTALNGFVAADASLAGKSLEEIVVSSAAAGGPLFNNAGQIWNHNMYWLSLSPNGGGIPGKLETKINEDFGSVAAFKEAFKQAGITQFGSGWSWLILGNDGKLKITKTPNAGSPLASGEGKTLMVVDVWEHAYYVDFRNRRPDFLQNWLDNLANYEYAASQL
jgi:Fe-Mn family superoxide dismutase